MRIPRGSSIPILVVAAASASLTLTGCVASLSDGSAEQQLEQALESQSDGELDVDLDASGNAEIPKDWPDSVPLPPGKPFQSSAFGPLMSIVSDVSDRQAAVIYVDEIVAAGFEQLDEEPTADGGIWSFTNGEFNVRYAVLDSGHEDGTVTAGVSVQRIES
jgi:hypothetical protein